VHEDNICSQPTGLPNVLGNECEPRSSISRTLDKAFNRSGRAWVQTRGWFIEEHDIGPCYECANQSETLLLAARQTVCWAPGDLGQASLLECATGEKCALPCRNVGCGKHILDVRQR
jgi:hypothetical protein